MTTNFIAADNEIFERINSLWALQAPAIFGYIPAIYWPGKAEPAKVDSSKCWARVTRRVVSEEQVGFVNCYSQSQTRYMNSGFIFIQLFGAVSESKSDLKVKQIASLLKNEFKRKATDSKIVFRNSRINPLDAEDLFFRYNVVFEYQYDELI